MSIELSPCESNSDSSVRVDITIGEVLLRCVMSRTGHEGRLESTDFEFQRQSEACAARTEPSFEEVCCFRPRFN